MNIKTLRLDDLRPGLLDGFRRYQAVGLCWRKEARRWVLRDDPFIEDWSAETKREIVSVDMADCLRSGGSVWAAVDGDGKVLGFACLAGTPMGSAGQYLQLLQLHVSHEARGHGLGRALFQRAAARAGALGAQKLYISAHSARETVAFYTRMGCVDAVEPDRRAIEMEPYDRQMEYIL